jgi:hypothetical protein
LTLRSATPKKGLDDDNRESQARIAGVSLPESGKTGLSVERILAGGDLCQKKRSRSGSGMLGASKMTD